MPSSSWSANFNSDILKVKDMGDYYIPLSNYYIPYTCANISCTTSTETISAPKILQLPAYGLRHDEINIKEIDGVLTIKSEPVDKAKYCTTINKTYTLKNVIIQSKTLSFGVLSVSFVDSENVIHHTINEGIDY